MYLLNSFFNNSIISIGGFYNTNPLFRFLLLPLPKIRAIDRSKNLHARCKSILYKHRGYFLSRLSSGYCSKYLYVCSYPIISPNSLQACFYLHVSFLQIPGTLLNPGTCHGISRMHHTVLLQIYLPHPLV